MSYLVIVLGKPSENRISLRHMLCVFRQTVPSYQKHWVMWFQMFRKPVWIITRPYLAGFVTGQACWISALQCKQVSYLANCTWQAIGYWVKSGSIQKNCSRTNIWTTSLVHIGRLKLHAHVGFKSMETKLNTDLHCQFWFQSDGTDVKGLNEPSIHTLPLSLPKRQWALNRSQGWMRCYQSYCKGQPVSVFTLSLRNFEV